MHAAPELHAFVSRLLIPPGQYIEIRLIVPDAPGAVQHFCTTTDDAITIATRATGTANVYVGACPRSRRSGTREAVTTVIGAWADLDFHQIDPNREVALELAYRRIEVLGIRPTMLIHSGNGLQVWWLFHLPAAVTADWPAERFEAINNGLAQRLGGDHVHDIGRVLRVPGTMNLPTSKKRERGCVAVMARLLDAEGPRYTPGDLMYLATAWANTSTPSHRGPAPLGHADQADTEIVAAFVELLKQLGSGHPLVRTWRGDRLLNDASRSGWDMALVNQLVRAGIKEEFVPAIVRAYRAGRGPLATDRYISRTLAKAKTSAGERHGAA